MKLLMAMYGMGFFVIGWSVLASCRKTSKLHKAVDEHNRLSREAYERFKRDNPDKAGDPRYFPQLLEVR